MKRALKAILAVEVLCLATLFVAATLIEPLAVLLLVGAVVGVAALAMLYCSAPYLLVLPRIWALRWMHLAVDRQRVRLSGFDVGVAEKALALLGLCCVAAAHHSWSSLAVTSACVCLLSSCRFSIEVRATTATLRRRVLWLLPWSTRSFERPYAWTDGWGDELDPLALWFGEEDEAQHRAESSIELAWSGRWSGGRAERLSRSFNEAVAALRAREHGVVE